MLKKDLELALAVQLSDNMPLGYDLNDNFKFRMFQSAFDIWQKCHNKSLKRKGKKTRSIMAYPFIEFAQYEQNKSFLSQIELNMIKGYSKEEMLYMKCLYFAFIEFMSKTLESDYTKGHFKKHLSNLANSKTVDEFNEKYKADKTHLKYMFT